MDADAVEKEDEAACSGDGDEHPGVDREAEDGGGAFGGSVGYEGRLGGPLEGADGSGRAGEHVGEVGEGDGLPGAEGVGGEVDEADGGDEDHTLAEPDDEALHQQGEAAADAELAEGFDGHEQPVFKLVDKLVAGEGGEESAEGRGEVTRSEHEDKQADDGDEDGDVGGVADLLRQVAAHGGDEDEADDEDVEELFEDDGGEDGGGGGTEIAGVGKDAHDVADAEGEDVVGGHGGHEHSGAGLEAGAAGTHHAGPADAAQRVADDGEADDAGDPGGMLEAEGAELRGVDAAEGIPEEKGADEKPRYGFG